MATSPTQKESLIADWLFSRALKSSVDDPPFGMAFKVSDRDNTNDTGYDFTTSRSPSDYPDGIPFTIYFLTAKELSSGSLPKDNDRSLTLLINPSELNYGSTQLVTSQYARLGFVNSLWGSSQGTLVGSGSSAAFIGPTYGLVGPAMTKSTAGVSIDGTLKKNTLAYGNVMSLVAVMRNNGYFPLAESKIYKYKSGAISQTASAPSSPVAASLSGNSQKTRIVHVMNVVAVKYDGSTYLGSFNSFSLEASADTPFRFSYSFEFAVSGLLGDAVDGHICDGENQKSGIIIKMQGSQFFTKSIQMDIDKVQAATKAIADANGPSTSNVLQASYTPEQIAINKAEVSKYVTLKEGNGVTFDKVHQEIIDTLPILNGVFKDYTSTVPQINSTTGIDQRGNRKANSLHSAGLAMDVHTSSLVGSGTYAGISHEQLVTYLEGETRRRLQLLYPDRNYYVNFETTLRNADGSVKRAEHIHIEYKGSTTGA